jgi:succinyl-CoA synthetase beta subunit
MKITNDVLSELGLIRNAIDDAYDVLNTTLYERGKAVKITYKEVNPMIILRKKSEVLVLK